MIRWSRSVCLVLVILGTASIAHGQGWSVPDQGAKAAALGEAFVARADDPTALYYNPAGITQIRGSAVSAGAYLLRFKTQFETANPGLGDDDHQRTYVLPHFYACSDLGTEDLRFGLGVNNSYGLAVRWDANGPFRAIVTKAQLAVLNFQPTVALALAEDLSIGAGLNVYYGNLERHSIVPGLSSELALRADGAAVGGTVGLRWSPRADVAVGLVYRSRFSLPLDGHATLALSAGQGELRAPVSLDLQHPDMVVAGVEWQPTSGVRLEVDLNWIDWTSLDDVRVQSPNPLFAAIPAEGFEFGTSLSIRAGIEVALSESVAIRAGYGFFPAVSPDDRFTPLVPDLDSHLFSAGVGVTCGEVTIDAAYQFIYRPNRDVRASVNSSPGVFRDQTHGVMLTATYRF